MPKVTVSARGQMVIPVELRRRLGITGGSQLELVEEAGGFRVRVKRSRPSTRHVDGYGMLVARGGGRRLSDFDVVEELSRSGRD